MPETMTSGQEKEAALIRLMEQYGGMLLNLCAVTLRDAAWAQDAVQETFVKAYRALEQLNSDRTTVYRRLDRARRKLKLMLTGEGGEDA